MEDFIQLIENDQFTQFVLNEYFADKSMTNKEKLDQVSSSMKEFTKAIDCFELKYGGANKH